MSGPIHRNVRSRGAPHIRPIVLETLEPRRLFSVILSLTNGVLQVKEDFNGVGNFTTVQVINEGTGIQIQESADSILVSGALFNVWTLSGDLHTASGPETGISSIVIDLGDGQDNLNIPSMNLPVLIQPSGAADESIDIGDRTSSAGAQGITQPITFDGTKANFATLDVDDGMDADNVDPTITSTSILDFAGAAINFTAPPQGNSPNAPLLVACETGIGTSGFVIDQDANNSTAIDYQIDGNGRGTISVEHLNSKSQLRVEGQTGGSEQVRLGSVGLISGIQGNVDIEGNAGSASLIVNDSSDTVAHTFAAQSSGSVLLFKEDGVQIAQMAEPSTAFTLETGPAANTVNVDLGSVSTGFVGTVDSGGTNDTIAVTDLQLTSELDLVGGAGVDNVSIRTDEVSGTVKISNPTGLEAVSIDASDVSNPQVISVTDSQVTGLGTASYQLSNLKSLSVTGGSAFDNFSVTPSATVPITLDGGPTSGASTDRLDINTAQATGTLLTLQSGGTNETGTYTFANRQPVNFTRFATITPTFGDLTGTVFNELTGAVVAGAFVIVADADLQTTTTDANGTFSFQGLPTGTFTLQAQSTGLENLSTITAIVSAGVLASPVVIPVVPLPAVSGPDLVVASVVATASGKTGSIKPRVRMKVSNLGLSMTSATSLQIVLVASPDNVLDPADQKLLTTSTPSVLLKANKSKTFTLSGSTATSLTKGNYFVLASVDAANAVAESNEANNVTASAKTVALAPPVVDLTGKFGKLPRTASASKLLPVSFAIRNLGTVPAAGTIDFDFFASTDTTLDDSDVSLGTGFPVAAHLAAGKSQPAKFKLSISPSLPTGSYYLVAKVNSTSSIAESDSTNNVVFSTTPIAIS